MDVRTAEREHTARRSASDVAVGPLRLSDTWIIGWRQTGQFVLAYLALTAVFAAVGSIAFGDDRRWRLVRLDERIGNWLVDRRTPTWNTLTLVGSWLAETVVKIGVTAVVVVMMLWLLRRWFEALFVALSLILEAAVFITVTYLVGRQRPDVPQLDDSPLASSYPSGHVAAAMCYVAVAWVLVRHVRRRWQRVACVVAFVSIPVVVGISRMYRGMHYLSDVIAGMLLGVASVWLTWRILRPAEQRRRAIAQS